MFRLQLVGEEKCKHEIKPGRNSIGRDSANDIVIGDDQVSGYHANIFYEDEQLVVVDLGSSNGTRINGRPISGRTSLKAWDKIVVGGTEIEVIDPSGRRPTQVQPAIQPGDLPPSKNYSPPCTSQAPLCILQPNGGGYGKPVEIRGLLRIGRSEDSDLALTQSTISTRHAEIQPTANGLEVKDLGSTNGTYVNGQRVTRRKLAHGDRLCFDEIAFIVSMPGAAPAKTMVNPAIQAPVAKTQLNIAQPGAVQSKSDRDRALKPASQGGENTRTTINTRDNDLSQKAPKVDPPVAPAPEPQEKSAAATRIEADIKAPPVMPPPVLSDDLDGERRHQTHGTEAHQSGSGFTWLFFSVDGRINRLTFFFASIGMTVANIGLLLSIHGLMFGSIQIVPGSQEYFVCLAMVWVIMLYPSIAIVIKRFHDQDRSGHFVWLTLIPIVNMIAGIMLLFVPGSNEANRFGRPPK